MQQSGMHRCFDRLIACQSQLNLLEEAESKRDFDPMTRCCTKPGAPAPHWKITHSADLLTLTTRSNFRVSLLLGCHGLESDAAKFRARRDGGNPMCKLCNSGEEDPVHFLAVCNALQAQRRVLLSHAPLNLYLTRHVTFQRQVTEIILGIDDWRLKHSSSNISLILNRKDLIYLSTNREHSTFQVYSPNKEATKRKESSFRYSARTDSSVKKM